MRINFSCFSYHMRKIFVVLPFLCEYDELCKIFHFSSNGNAPSNDEMLRRKRNTTMYTGHSSLWAHVFLKNQGLRIDEKWHLDPSDYAEVGGAFPIFQRGFPQVQGCDAQTVPQDAPDGLICLRAAEKNRISVQIGGTDMVRMALIGAGGMGRKYAQMISEGRIPSMSLTAVVARNDGARAWAREKLGAGVQLFDSADALFDAPDLYDAVLIVTPHRLHPELAVRAFELGKHVFTDKPLGISVDQCRKMLDMAASTGKVFAVMYHQRRYRKFMRIKEILESGEIGTVRRVLLENSRYYRTEHYHHSSPWRSSWNGEGGGALINQGQHILDIWQWLFGMPEKLSANIPFGKYNDFEVDDEASLFMDYKDGMTAVFLLTTGEGVWKERMVIAGSKGEILMDRDRLTITRFSEDLTDYSKTSDTNSREGIVSEVTQEEYPVTEEPYPEMLENFAQAAENGTPLFAPGAEGIHALELCNAAYYSAWTGQQVSFPFDWAAYEREYEEHCRSERSKV